METQPRDDIRKFFEKTEKHFNIDDYIDDLQNALCVLIQDGLVYKFSHRSFQEYFTAYYLKELDDNNMQKCGTQLMKKNPEKIMIDQVFSMLSDMTKERFLKNILLPILNEINQGITDEEPFLYYLRMLDGRIVFINHEPSVIPPQYHLTLSVSVFHQNKMDIQTLISYLIIFVRDILPGIDMSDSAQAKSKIAENELLRIVQKEGLVDEETTNITITSDIIVKNSKAREALMKTWIGRDIQNFIMAKEVIMKTEAENDEIIDQLLKE